MCSWNVKPWPNKWVIWVLRWKDVLASWFLSLSVSWLSWAPFLHHYILPCFFCLEVNYHPVREWAKWTFPKAVVMRYFFWAMRAWIIQMRSKDTEEWFGSLVSLHLWILGVFLGMSFKGCRLRMLDKCCVRIHSHTYTRINSLLRWYTWLFSKKTMKVKGLYDPWHLLQSFEKEPK